MANIKMNCLKSNGQYETLYPKVDLSNIVGTLSPEHGGTGGVLPPEYEGTGVTSISALMTTFGAARVQTGSYVGTGTYGADNPCSLMFIILHNLFCYLFNREVDL